MRLQYLAGMSLNKYKPIRFIKDVEREIPRGLFRVRRNYRRSSRAIRSRSFGTVTDMSSVGSKAWWRAGASSWRPEEALRRDTSTEWDLRYTAR
jgi:hypothetical protein